MPSSTLISPHRLTRSTPGYSSSPRDSSLSAYALGRPSEFHRLLSNTGETRFPVRFQLSCLQNPLVLRQVALSGDSYLHKACTICPKKRARQSDKLCRVSLILVRFQQKAPCGNMKTRKEQDRNPVETKNREYALPLEQAKSLPVKSWPSCRCHFKFCNVPSSSCM